MTAGVKYRPDIDGLRAVAVLSVVLYHFDIGRLQGGFVGVDVFFVISGYLITGIIYREVADGTFSFAGFYERRARRIFPALFAMLLATLAIGPFVLLPSDLANLGKVTAATLAFGSNILFWRQAGYFDTTSHFSPLLHTWSLAVEEQFYLFFPVVLLVVHRYVRRGLAPVLAVSALTTFGLCWWQQAVRPDATFYLAPFRAWELLVGAMLAIGMVPLLRPAFLREAIALIALVALAGSVFMIEAGVGFPGWQAAIPVIATGAIIHSGTSGSTLVNRWLGSAPLVFVGLVSYSLYLWHWPVLVYARYRQGMEPLATWPTILLLLLVFGLACASYRWVELPLRRGARGRLLSTRRALWTAAAASVACLAAVGAMMMIGRGLPGRVPASVVALDRDRAPALPFSACNLVVPAAGQRQCRAGDRSARVRTLLWGDSHALAWAPGLDLVGTRRHIVIDLALASACAPLLDVINPANADCLAFNRKVFAFIRRTRPAAVYLVASWPAYSDPAGPYVLSDATGRQGNGQVFAPALRRTVDALRPYVGRIVLIGRVPGVVGTVHFGGDVPFKLALARWNGSLPLPQRPVPEVLAEQRWYRAAVDGYAADEQVQIVDPIPWFCDSRSCRYRDPKGALLYRDTNHLSLAGAGFVAQRLSLDPVQP